jgi:DNA-binding response OmpR family regulator
LTLLRASLPLPARRRTTAHDQRGGRREAHLCRRASCRYRDPETDVLQEAGFTVRVVSLDDADTAIEAGDAGLLVITAGPRDGIALARLLAKANLAKVPVIVTTTGRTDLDCWQSAVAVLLKPFSFEELVARVRAHFAVE